jgi:hypothetical protein
MAVIDGAADLITFRPFTYSASGAVGPWVATPVAPLTGDRLPSVHPSLEVIVSAATPPASVQFDLATDAGFTAIVWTATDTLVPNGAWSHFISPYTLTDLTKYWWRVRAGDGAGVWGPWSTAQSFTPDLNAGRGYAEVFLNVGIDPLLIEDYAGRDAYLNQGVTLGSVPIGIEFLYENVGLILDRPGAHDAVDTIYLGDVNTATPTPHLWFIRPTSGRAGDGISIVGHGLGSLPGTYGGVVEYDAGGGSWTAVPVVTWQVYPGTAAALTAGRTIDTELAVIDPEHTTVEIVVPAGALPPGYPIRIRTEGP